MLIHSKRYGDAARFHMCSFVIYQQVGDTRMAVRALLVSTAALAEIMLASTLNDWGTVREYCKRYRMQHLVTPAEISFLDSEQLDNDFLDSTIRAKLNEAAVLIRSLPPSSRSHELAQYLISYGRFCAHTGDREMAIDLLLKATGVVHDGCHRATEAYLLAGQQAYILGRLEDAELYLLEGIRGCLRERRQIRLTGPLYDLSHVLNKLNRREEAIAAIGHSVSICIQTSLDGLVGALWKDIAILLRERGGDDYAEALCLAMTIACGTIADRSVNMSDRDRLDQLAAGAGIDAASLVDDAMKAKASDGGAAVLARVLGIGLADTPQFVVDLSLTGPATPARAKSHIVVIDGVDFEVVQEDRPTF